MIFGDNFTSSGVYTDIEEASVLANKAIRKFAMGTDPIHLAVQTSQNDDTFAVSDKYSAEAIRIVKECELMAEEILQRNKLLLLKIADYLTVNSKMDEHMIRDFVRDYAAEDWVHTDGLIKKDQYYQFNTILQKQLLELENDSVNLEIETLFPETSH
jgi:cell division protease FtsH